MSMCTTTKTCKITLDPAISLPGITIRTPPSPHQRTQHSTSIVITSTYPIRKSRSGSSASLELCVCGCVCSEAHSRRCGGASPGCGAPSSWSRNCKLSRTNRDMFSCNTYKQECIHIHIYIPECTKSESMSCAKCCLATVQLADTHMEHNHSRKSPITLPPPSEHPSLRRLRRCDVATTVADVGDDNCRTYSSLSLLS